jgi:hypothetical protein
MFGKSLRNHSPSSTAGGTGILSEGGIDFDTVKQ